MPQRPVLRFLTALILLAGSLSWTCAMAARAPREGLAQPPDHARLVDAIRAYASWLDALQARDAVPGLATAVIDRGHVAFERTQGYADVDTRLRMTPSTVFRIASLSKAFASALAGILVDNGRLTWDTRLVDVLPFFDLSRSGATRQATVADILGQRLGLPRHTYDQLLEANVPYPRLARELDQVDLRCEVGTCYSYQNVAFSLIGDVIHARTGDFYGHQVERRLFLPLGMTTATYGLDALEQSRRWARPHWRHGRVWSAFSPRDVYYHVAPAAGVNASLRDMELWLIAQMGGRPDVLPPHLLATLHKPGVATPSERFATAWRRARIRDASYALGWRVYDYAGQTIIFHAGAVRGYRAMIGFLPGRRIGMVMLWNSGSAQPARLFPMFMDRLLGLPAHDWAGIEGPRAR